MDKKNKKIKGRAVISLLTSWMFLVMTVTGIVLYIVPQGRIAYWVDWRLLGLTKTDWGNIHIATSLLFVIVGIWHIYFNWKAFLGHLRKKLAQGIKVRTELYVTIVVTILVSVSALWKIPPIGYLIDLNDSIKASWIESPEYEPPFGHAELLSLKALCKKTQIDLKAAKQKLKENGFQVANDRQTLETIAI